MKLARHWMLLLFACASHAQSADSGTDASKIFIEAIDCKGNATISCDFIRRKAHIPINAEVDSDTIENAQLRLSALSNFRAVRVYLEKGSAQGKAILIVEVEEASAIVTEFAIGASYSSIERNSAFVDDGDAYLETAAGRVSDQNLFGKQKIGEISVGASHGSDRATGQRAFSTTGVYIDPNLFGSERWFSSLSLRYSDAEVHNHFTANYYDPFVNAFVAFDRRSDASSQAVSGSLALGYRLWDYQYVLAGVTYSANRTEQDVSDSSAGLQHLVYRDRFRDFGISYVWDSEDDAYFPTRGWRLSATVSHTAINAPCINCEDINWNLAYKQSWMSGAASVWTLNVGGEPVAAGDRLRPIALSNSGGLSVRFAHLLQASDSLGGIARGRWYVQAGLGPLDLRNDGRIGGGVGDAHLAVGVRFESKTLGMIELQLAANRSWQ